MHTFKLPVIQNRTPQKSRKFKIARGKLWYESTRVSWIWATCPTFVVKCHNTMRYIGLIFKCMFQDPYQIRTWVWWVEHLGMTSLRCLAIRSKSWLTRIEGDRDDTPPLGIVISSRHMGHLNCPVSRANVATIRSKHWRHTVWQHVNDLGLCSPPSYMPKNKDTCEYIHQEVTSC